MFVLWPCRSDLGERGRRWSVVSVASSGYKTEATDSPVSLSVSSHFCAFCACPVWSLRMHSHWCSCRGGPTCVLESLQVQCIWPGRYHVTAMTSMHWTCSDSSTHVGPPLVLVCVECVCYNYCWLWTNVAKLNFAISKLFVQFLSNHLILLSPCSPTPPMNRFIRWV